MQVKGMSSGKEDRGRRRAWGWGRVSGQGSVQEKTKGLWVEVRVAVQPEG